LIEEILTARSYYDILGLSGSRKRDPENFSSSNLRKTYLQRSKIIHPDRHGNSARVSGLPLDEFVSHADNLASGSLSSRPQKPSNG
jgi:curved DNA-binding protein CbpA